jgi:uncharacterized protein
VTIQVDLEDVRRIAVAAQKLDRVPSRSGIKTLESTARAINCLQLDPTPVVARNEYLVLWSRLGNYDRKLLGRLSWEKRTMFEYWAHAASLVMTEDWPLHEPTMRAYRRTGTAKRHLVMRDWMAENKKLRDTIMREIKRQGPLPSRYFTDLRKSSWTKGDWYEGWNQGRHVGRMLDCLWTQGRLMVSHRQRATRFWDLTERVMPDWTPRERLSEEEVVRRGSELALRSLGIATERHVRLHYMRRGNWKLRQQLEHLEKTGTAHRVTVVKDGVPDAKPWWIHSDHLHLLDGGPGSDRTTLLSPFDNLICDRDRTEFLWDFFFRIEIYVPKPKRQYGYFVMPVLHGDDVVGRLDLAVDREAGVLNAIAVYAEPKAPASAGPGIASALKDLAAFCKADSIAVGKAPPVWKKALAF